MCACAPHVVRRYLICIITTFKDKLVTFKYSFRSFVFFFYSFTLMRTYWFLFKGTHIHHTTTIMIYLRKSSPIYRGSTTVMMMRTCRLFRGAMAFFSARRICINYIFLHTFFAIKYLFCIIIVHPSNFCIQYRHNTLMSVNVYFFRYST